MFQGTNSFTSIIEFHYTIQLPYKQMLFGWYCEATAICLTLYYYRYDFSICTVNY